MPNQVTASTDTLHSPIPHVKPPHHCSVTAAAFSCCFFYFLFFLSLSQHVSPCHCCPALLCIYTHSCLCPSCPSSLFPFPLSRPLFLHFFFFFTAQGEILVSTVPPLHLHFLFGWVVQSTVIQTIPRNKICAPWWRRGKWKSYTRGCIMRTGYHSFQLCRFLTQQTGQKCSFAGKEMYGGLNKAQSKQDEKKGLCSEKLFKSLWF